VVADEQKRRGTVWIRHANGRRIVCAEQTLGASWPPERPIKRRAHVRREIVYDCPAPVSMLLLAVRRRR
jgi:hypothetical protein